jgi:hypothetical protein
MNKINLELEIKKLARLFAEKQKIKVEVFFHRPPESKFNDEWYRHRGFCDSRTVPGLHQIYINLKRDTWALIFRTLAHELAHAWQWEVGKNRKHNLSFWQTLDDYTLPFVLDNLSKEDREGLLNLLNPTTNQDEENDWVHWEAEEKIISFSVERENINEQWKAIRQETMKGNLGFKTYVSTKKTSHDKYRILIYFNESEGEVARIMERLGELGVDETEVKVR